MPRLTLPRELAVPIGQVILDHQPFDEFRRFIAIMSLSRRSFDTTRALDKICKTGDVTTLQTFMCIMQVSDEAVERNARTLLEHGIHWRVWDYVRNRSDAQKARTNTLLVDATRTMSMRIMEYLLHESCPTTVAQLRTALLTAIDSSYAVDVPPTITALLRHPNCQPEANDNEALMASLVSGKKPITEALLADSRVSWPSDTAETYLQCLCNGYYEWADEIDAMYPDFDISVNDNAALYAMLEARDPVGLSMIMEHPQVDPSANDNWAFILASTHMDYLCMHVLLGDRRVNPDARGRMAWRIARDGKNNILKLYLNRTRGRNLARRLRRSQAFIDSHDLAYEY